jgi:hypothetical protein
MAAVAVLLSTTSTVMVLRWGASSTGKPAIVYNRQSDGPEAPPGIPPRYPADNGIPKSLNAARERYLFEIPERVATESFGSYLCAGRMHHRAISGFLTVPRKAADLKDQTRYYADKFFEKVWTTKVGVRYEYPRTILRSYDGRVAYLGVRIDGEFDTSVPDPCGDSRGVVRALALDHGDCYLVFIVIVGLGGDARYGELPSEQDAQVLLDSMGPF